MSTSKATVYGYIIKMEGKRAEIIKNNEVLVETWKCNGLYKVNSNEIPTFNTVNRKGQGVRVIEQLVTKIKFH